MSYSSYSSLRSGAALAPLRPGAVALAPPRRASAAASLLGIVARLGGRIGGRIGACLRAYAEASAKHRRAQETVRQLMALGNRELKDMGLSRSEILSVVYGPSGARKVKYHADA